MPGEIRWGGIPGGGVMGGVNGGTVTFATGDCITQNFTVAAGDIPAAGAMFRGARMQTNTPSATVTGRICLYLGSGDGVPLLGYCDFVQVANVNRAVYEGIFAQSIPVVAGTYQLMISSPFAGVIELLSKNAPGTVGRLRTTGGTYDPPMDPLSTNGNSTLWLAMEAFALAAPPLPDLIFGGGRA